MSCSESIEPFSCPAHDARYIARLTMPPFITLEIGDGFALCTVKAVISGRSDEGHRPRQD
jgi:hypothetical protein